MEHQNEIKTIEAEINTLLSIPYKVVRLLNEPDKQQTVILHADFMKILNEKRELLKILKKR